MLNEDDDNAGGLSISVKNLLSLFFLVLIFLLALGEKEENEGRTYLLSRELLSTKL